MVHLAAIPTDASVASSPSSLRRPSPAPGSPLQALHTQLDGLKLDLHDKIADGGDDQFTTTVYASRFAARDLPKHEMPEMEMPKEVAYRMIKDETSLDGNPMLK
jgi:glutamate decarboxylase